MHDDTKGFTVAIQKKAIHIKNSDEFILNEKSFKKLAEVLV